VNRQVAVDRDTGALLLIGFRFLSSITSSDETPTALSGTSLTDTRPGHINAAIKVKQAWRGGKHHVRRHIQTHHRRYGNPHPAALRRNLRAPVVNLRPVGVAAEAICPWRVFTVPCRVERVPLKFIASWLGCISNGIKLPSISTPFSCI
jgi:hypothetical protein